MVNYSGKMWLLHCIIFFNVVFVALMNALSDSAASKTRNTRQKRSTQKLRFNYFDSNVPFIYLELTQVVFNIESKIEGAF